jgi:hypothetical protein
MAAVVSALMSPTAVSAYSFGDWASDQGYDTGDAMPRVVSTRNSSLAIDSLDGIGDFDWTTTPTTKLELRHNQLSNIESGAFIGLTNLKRLSLVYNTALINLNLAKANFTRLGFFDVKDNVNIKRVSLKKALVDQLSLSVLLYGGVAISGWRPYSATGIGELDGITEMDLSAIDFSDINDLSPLCVMDDLTDLLQANTQNMDAVGLDELLDNLKTIEGTATEGVLYMTQADYDAFNIAGGGLLADWNAEEGHHVAFVVPEPSSIVLLLPNNSMPPGGSLPAGVTTLWHCARGLFSRGTK